MGGMLQAIEEGFPQKEISKASFDFQKSVDSQQQVIVGVNKYADEQTSSPIPLHKVDPKLEETQRQKVIAFKKARNQQAVAAALENIRAACVNGANVMPVLIDAVDIGVTVGEVSDIYREVFGVYRDPGFV